MIYKVLSVKQPYAMLICTGVKTVENRSWKTTHRGKILIHASGDNFAYPDFKFLPKQWQKKMLDMADRNNWNDASQGMLNYSELLKMTYKFYGEDIEEQKPPKDWLKEAVKKHGYFLESQAIIGECELVDIVRNSADPFAEPGCYHWILDNAILYDTYIHNVLGHLRLWQYDLQDGER
jgi:hypothetical protein